MGWLAIVLLVTVVQPSPVDDAALDTLLAAEPRVAVCIWSPHMPLSVEAVAEVMAAGRVLGITVVPLLDPRADETYAASVARQAQLPDGALRRAVAHRLMRADAFQHAPAVVTFENSQQTGPPIVGYRGLTGYESIIRSRFSR